MSCEHTQEHLLDYLNHQLSPDERQTVETHLTGCPDCQIELHTTQQLWQKLGSVPAPEPSEHIRPAFYAMLASFKEEELKPQRPSAWVEVRQWLQAVFTPQFVGQVAYSVCLLVLGVAGGYWLTTQRQEAASASTGQQQQLAALSSQVQEMRQVMLLSLIDDPSATERLRAVSYTKELKRPQPRVVEALLSTLNHDDNVNVRLATLEALAELAPADPKVRLGLVRSLSQQDSPLVQSALADVMVQLQEKDSVKPLRRLLAQPDLNEAVKNKLQESIRSLSGDDSNLTPSTHETLLHTQPAQPADLVI
ncbi:HEAT repeat domain-containing protein [Hymenobacter sp. CRA2]|uniref:HEAT repeat domain-containing protein n=1 Tax=Hymenobacter sp. CRA2 TaxID=1955620 RepID=UPI00098F4DFB|nr:HEAT repeat domain-containing protein [Hymenobacter sp. CRA2]OON69706.1 hypothetical protein B0919_07185 [Hymenobacter sp. CRA2]